jgi:hypothetical protein
MTEEVPSTTSNNDASKQYQSKRHVFKKPVTKAPQFEGKCAELNGHTYDCSDPQQAADMYAKHQEKSENTSDEHINMEPTSDRLSKPWLSQH